MWNILIVIIIAAVIWMLSPALKMNQNPNVIKTGENTAIDIHEKSTKSVVDSLTEETQKQVDEARRLNQEQQESLNN